MHIDDLNWNDLKYFLALSREGSVSGAGRLLGVKHTTVARRIQALEDHLGTRLFDRSRSGYSMTQSAENLLHQVQFLEDRIHGISREASGQDGALSGPLKLTIAQELANRLIIPELSGFCLAYPKIDLQLLMTKGLVDLSTMEADIAIRMTPNPPEDLVGKELMKLNHGIYGSRFTLIDLLLHQQQESSSPVNVILFEDEREPPAWVTDNFKQFNIALRVDDVGSMAIAAKAGIGLAKLPRFIGRTEPELQVLDINTGPTKWGIWLLYHGDLRATARVRACKEFLEKTLENKRSLIQGDKTDYDNGTFEQ